VSDPRSPAAVPDGADPDDLGVPDEDELPEGGAGYEEGA
jgi:hypothetical protein